MDNVNNAGRQSAQLFSSIFKGAEDTLTKFYQTGKLGARDFVNMISGELARLTAQKTMSSLGNLFGNTGIGESGIVSAVSHFFGFADGGIMTSAGPMPLKAYSNGGVANSPQLTLFGEGRTPEAFVPLPDGRSIPVSLTTTGSSSNRSTTQGDININIIMNTATGTTQSSGATSSPNLSQLSAGIAQTVRQVIVNEQRQGGLLAIGAK
jgi:phage-related minor tail protein